MPTARRRRTAALTAAFVLATALPATAGPGPVPIDTKDSYIPARTWHVSSSTSGTVYVTDAGTGVFGHVYLVPTVMTTGSSRVDLGDRASANTDAADPTISGTRAAVPQSAFLSDTITTVKHCLVGTCPTMTTFTVPAGYRYLGNAGDRAILLDETTGDLGLATWDTVTITTIDLPEGYDAQHATGDAAGVLLQGSGALYVRRSDSHVSGPIDALEAVLTPTFLVWWYPGEDYQTKVYVVARGNADAPATTLHTLTGSASVGNPGFDAFTATDAGVAWISDDDRLYTLPMAGGTPVLYPRPLEVSQALAPFEGESSILVHDYLAGIPGFYRVTIGSTSGTLTGLLPVRHAMTLSASLSNGRIAYTDDMTELYPAFLVDAPNGVPDTAAETAITHATHGQVALGGPYVAFAQGDRLYYGRPGSLRSVALASADRGRIAVSGRHALISGGQNSRLVDMVTGSVTNLGHVNAALFGDYLVLLNYDTGKLERKNLATGAVQLIRSAVPGCTTYCVDEEWWALQPWGHEVVYAYRHQGGGLRTGRWDGNTNTTAALPGLSLVGDSISYYDIRYWDGLLLVYKTDFSIDLYDLRSGTPTVEIEAEDYGDAPMGLDGHNVAWRRLDDLRVVVRPVTDLVPGHNAAPRYLGGNVPRGFAPGTATDEWKPSFLTSQDVSWTLTLRSGSASGPVVRTLTGDSLHGEARPVWDGTDTVAADVPQGTYHWTLEGTGPGALPLRQASGSTTPISGTVYVSRAPLGAPVVSSPTRSTDTSATSSFTVSWTAPAGAPAGTTYTLQRSVNGGDYATVASGITTLSRTYTAPSPGTYRFRVWATDPGGRAGATSASDVTMVPYDDDTSTMSYAGSWGSGTSSLLYGGTHHRSTAAGSTFSFKATGTQIHLIGIKASSYGQFQVSIDGGAYSGLVDAYSSTTKYRQVLWSRTGLSNTTHTIKVRVYGTSGRPAVGIDGVAFLR